MNVVLWIIQILLGLLFLMTGYLKVCRYEKTKLNMAWVNDVPKGLVIFIGVAELLGGIGIILPTAIDVSPILTPISGFVLSLIMVFAAIFHSSRKEYKSIVINAVLLLLALFVALGRF